MTLSIPPLAKRMQSEWASQTLGPQSNNAQRSNKTPGVDPAMKVSSLALWEFWSKHRRCYMKGFSPFLSLRCITVHEPDSVLIHLQWMPLLPCIEKRSVPEKQSSRRLRLLSAPLWVQVNNFSGLERAVSAPHKKVNMLYASRCFCKSGLYVFWRADI